MTQVRAAAVALNQTPLDWEGNLENVLQGMAQARREGATVVCFPELCLSGYGCEDAFLWPDTTSRALESLLRVVSETKGLVVSVGLPLWIPIQGEGGEPEERLYNGAALIADGKLLGVACKCHLASDGLHYEPRWFSAWRKGSSTRVAVAGDQVPVGDVIFELGAIRFGFEICEDAWVPDRAAPGLGEAGVSLILSPSASHFSFGKHLVRREIVRSGVRSSGAAYVYCNLLGNEAGRAIYDGDCLISEGEGGAGIVAEAIRLSFEERQMAVATLDLRPRSGSFTQGEVGREVVSVAFEFPLVSRADALSRPTSGYAEDGSLGKEDAFSRAVALGLFDYLRKSNAKGFVVSLSGGADSTAVVLLVRLMIRMAWRQLGEKEFKRRLSEVLPSDVSSLGEDDIARRLLLTVYQGTRNSGEVTRKAASQVAEALGAEHHEVNVDDFVDGYRKLAEGVQGRDFSWERDDIALQNIQARARAPGVWMLANVRGALLLATSNRSEVAVGYATMDGDTCGGLAPIAGVDKEFLLRWLVFMEKKGLPEWGPIPELNLVNGQKPTAELRPPEATQTDEQDLMPYEVLSFIEHAGVVRRIPAIDVVSMVSKRFEVSIAQARSWVERFYRLFARSQWKRERFAPSFHLDEGNLDPRTWCRYPILSGGDTVL